MQRVEVSCAVRRIYNIYVFRRQRVNFIFAFLQNSPVFLRIGHVSNVSILMFCVLHTDTCLFGGRNSVFDCDRKNAKICLTFVPKRLKTLDIRQFRRQWMVVLHGFQSLCLRQEFLGDLICWEA